MVQADPIGALRRHYPWPAERPAVPAVDWNMDGGGRQLVTELIGRRQAKLMLEIGVFLGGSLRTWLEASPELVVIACDPWSPGFRGDFVKARGRPELAAQFDAEDGLYRSFIASNWQYRDRIIPVRVPSPEALHAIAQLGAQPEIVYIDSDKQGSDLSLCRELFPDTVLCGDDWTWGTDRWRDVDAGYPIREPVKRFVAENGLHLRTHRATWVADPEPPTAGDKIRQALVDLRMVGRRVRAIKRALRSPDRPAESSGT